jgi:hypothetical protein
MWAAAAAARRAGVLGWWYSTVRVRFWITFRGKARGRGKDCREALAGARWLWLTWPSRRLEAFAVGVRSLRSGSAMGTPTATPTASPTLRRSALQTMLILGHNLRRETTQPHRTRFTGHASLHTIGGKGKRGGLPKRALPPPSRLKAPRCPPISVWYESTVYFLPSKMN